MAIQLIDLGASANNGLGDKLRIGGDKINDNFTEIYDKLISDNFVVVKTLADFPTPVANVISLNALTTYFITDAIDLLGNSLYLDIGSVLKGTSVSVSAIYSSLPITTDLIVSVSTIDFSNIKFLGTNIDSLFNISSDSTNSVIINKCEFTDFTTSLGTILEYGSVSINGCSFNNCGELNFNGTIDVLKINNCIGIPETASTLFNVLSTCIITYRLSIYDNVFICNGTSTAINVHASATIPTSGYVLIGNTFTGAGTYVTGLASTDPESFFKINVGITNTI